MASDSPCKGEAALPDGLRDRLSLRGEQVSVSLRKRDAAFATHPARLPDLALEELPEWLRLHVRVGRLGLFGRPRRRRRGLDPRQIDMRAVGIQNEEHRVIAEIAPTWARTRWSSPRSSCSSPTAVLYDRLLSDFPSWLTAARRAGIVE